VLANIDLTKKTSTTSEKGKVQKSVTLPVREKELLCDNNLFVIDTEPEKSIDEMADLREYVS